MDHTPATPDTGLQTPSKYDDDPLVKTLVWVVAAVIVIVATATALVVVRSVAAALEDFVALAGLLALGWCAGLTLYVRRLAGRDHAL